VGELVVTLAIREHDRVAAFVSRARLDANASSSIVVDSMSCRVGCGACCIAPSITTPFRDMPHGKRAGERCAHLDERNRCRLFGHPDRPSFCSSLRPHASMCSESDVDALAILTNMELATRPD